MATKDRAELESELETLKEILRRIEKIACTETDGDAQSDLMEIAEILDEGSEELEEGSWRS